MMKNHLQRAELLSHLNIAVSFLLLGDNGWCKWSVSVGKKSDKFSSPLVADSFIHSFNFPSIVGDELAVLQQSKTVGLRTPCPHYICTLLQRVFYFSVNILFVKSLFASILGFLFCLLFLFCRVENQRTVLFVLVVQISELLFNHNYFSRFCRGRF